MTNATFLATAWNNGKWHASSAGYGLKVSVADRDRFFRRDWRTVFPSSSRACRPHAHNLFGAATNDLMGTRPGQPDILPATCEPLTIPRSINNTLPTSRAICLGVYVAPNSGDCAVHPNSSNVARVSSSGKYTSRSSVPP